MRARRLLAAALVLLALVLTGLALGAALQRDPAGGAGGGDRPSSGSPALPEAPGRQTAFSPEAAQAGPPGASSVIATARAASVRVFRRPGGRAARIVRARTVGGRRLPLVFLVQRRRPGWVRVQLPTRPNLATGWLRTGAVRLSVTTLRIRVALRSHRLTLLRAGRPILRTRIAKGRAVSPTPTGRYFVTDLLRPPDPNGPYGPYALGLSAHSPVYTSFEGGDGQIGLHGTNDPSALGRDVSHGCIRVANRVITRLARVVPLGAPVDITRR
jgi:lipoprotein-anchoring transpeptidase ErfK/SrfK